MSIHMAKMKRLCAIRKRTRDSVTQEHIRYNGKLLGQIAALYSAQNRRVRNPEKQRMVCGDMYEFLRELGEVYACAVDLRTDKEAMTAVITCRGKQFCLGDEVLADVFHLAQGMTLTAAGDEFTLELQYDLYDKQPAADYSRRIEGLEFCFKASGLPEVEE